MHSIQILRDTEHEAQRVLNHELKQLEGTVSGQRQETQALGKDVKWLKENIQVTVNEEKIRTF